MPKKRWRRRGRRAASSHSSSPAKRTPTRPQHYKHDEPDDRLTVRARATGRGARSSRRTPQSVVPEKEKNRIMHNKGAVLGRGRSRGSLQSVATYAKGGGGTSRGRTRRGSVGSAGGALPNRTHLQCFVSTWSRARRGAGRYSPAGSRRPSWRAGRPRGLVGSAQVEEEASPVPWAGKPRRLGKKETISPSERPKTKKSNHARGIMIACIGQKKNGIGNPTDQSH